MRLQPIFGGGGGPPGGPPDPPPIAAIPALLGSPSGATAGSIWVDGSTLNYIATTGQHWGGTGTAITTPVGAVAGSIWEDAGEVYYIDATGIQRRLQRTTVTTRPSGATPASMWPVQIAAMAYGMCWVALALYGPDSPWFACAFWQANKAPHGRWGRLWRSAYRRYGPRLSQSPTALVVLRPVFYFIARRGARNLGVRL